MPVNAPPTPTAPEDTSQQQEAGSPLDRLPDPVLLLILAGVGHPAQHLIRCAAVCRRLNRLVWQAPNLTFNISNDPIHGPDVPEAAIAATVARMADLRSLALRSHLVVRPLLGAAFVSTLASHCRGTLRRLSIGNLDNNGDMRVLVRHVARCQRLEELRLEGVGRGRLHGGESEPPDGAAAGALRLPRLHTLALERLHLSDELVRALVAGSPALEEVTLRAVGGLESPVLEGPRLVRVHVSAFQTVLDIYTK